MVSIELIDRRDGYGYTSGKSVGSGPGETRAAAMRIDVFSVRMRQDRLILPFQLDNLPLSTQIYRLGDDRHFYIRS